MKLITKLIQECSLRKHGKIGELLLEDAKEKKYYHIQLTNEGAIS